METKGVSLKAGMPNPGFQDLNVKESNPKGSGESLKEMAEGTPVNSPPADREEIEKLAEELGNKLESFGNYKVSFNIDKNSEVVIRIVDKESNKLIKQIPSEDIVKLKEHINGVKGVLLSKVI